METLKRWLLDFRVLFLVIVSTVAFNGSDVPLRPREMVSLLEEGKRQYNLIQSKTTLPSFGKCWKDAISSLHVKCNQLDDRIQSDVALGFANCFLEGAGMPRHECERSPYSPQQCLKSMPDRAFIAYTEFFTHTQSMCFFIMSQVWHEETDKTINRLSTSAADVARQLEASEELQEELLLQQRQSVVMQQELLENGVSLGSMLHESRDSLKLIFNEFRSSTLEQQRLLSMVFHHLSTLQSWIVGEVSWVDSIAFYIPSFAFVYFLTSAQRTAKGRIPGFLVLLLSGLTERFISYILLSDDGGSGSFQPVDIVNERLNWWVWLVRRAAIATNIGCLLITLYCYKDRDEVMHHLLEHIRHQNEELLKHLRGGDRNRAKDLSKINIVDEADGFGYHPIPILASSSLSTSGLVATPSWNESPSVSNHVAKSVSDSNGTASPGRKISLKIPTPHSAFKPIKEDTVESLADSSIPSTEQTRDAPSHTVISSTPKAKSRKRTTASDDSFGTARYNLRRSSSRSCATSPA